MWKVRRKEIRRNLVDDDLVQDEPAPESAVQRLRQRLQESGGLLWSFETGKMVVYFGIPIMLLAWTDTIYSQTDVQARQYLSRLTPSVARAHDDLGVAHMRERRYDEAIGALLRAIDIDSCYARAYTHLGIAFSAKGDRQRAIEYHLRAIELDPGMATAYFNLAVDYHSTDQTSSAIGQLERAVELDPEYAKAYGLLSQLHKKQGNMEESVRLEKRARELAAAAHRRFLGRTAMPWATATPVFAGGEP
jgi:tetratricopeptide (TPR) repeat protein